MPVSGIRRLSDVTRRLSPPARVLLAAEIVVAYLRAQWLLRRHTLPEAASALRAGARRPSGAGSGNAEVTGARLARAVVRTLALLPTDSRCLVRSLVLTALLARRGIDSSLLIGVRPGSRLAAHAWVEHASKPLLPSGEPDYERLVEI